jgi:hypothetical protein
MMIEKGARGAPFLPPLGSRWTPRASGVLLGRAGLRERYCPSRLERGCPELHRPPLNAGHFAHQGHRSPREVIALLPHRTAGSRGAPLCNPGSPTW